jgi:hypothetical protein
VPPRRTATMTSAMKRQPDQNGCFSGKRTQALSRRLWLRPYPK